MAMEGHISILQDR